MTKPSVSMNCIVTGGAGFIGSHLCDALIARGHRVTALDNLATGRLSNIAALRDSQAFEFIEADVTDADALVPLFNGVDWVFHMAALADIVPSIEQPQLYHRANVDGTVNVLEASRLAGAKRFIYAASSSSYGIPDEYPTPETAAQSPQYPYALTKSIGERYALHWAGTYGLPVIALRLFNVFGPRHRTAGTYGAVFGVFLAQKLAGKPFTVVGDGLQTRDFTYVTDVANAFITAAGSDAVGSVFNVGSGGTYSINRLVELLGGKVERIPKRPGEPECTFADISKIRRELNWEPTTTFEQGVDNILRHIDEWRDAPVWTSTSIETATKSWFKYLGPVDTAPASDGDPSTEQNDPCD